MIVNLHQYQDQEIFSFDTVNGDNRTIEAAFANITSGPTPEAARAAIGAAGNKNLINNGYFIGNGQPGNFPIDQNGDGTPDRWVITNGNTQLKFTNSGTIISNSSTSGGGIICLRQYFGENVRNDIPVTVSIFVSEISGTWYFGGRPIPNVLTQGVGVTTVTVEPSPDNDFAAGFYFWKSSLNPGDYIKVQVAKMEYGRVQTIGHQENGIWILDERPPEYGAELLKCQRYYQLYSSAAERPAKAVDCRPVMRIDPTQGTTIIGGVTYYYNNASL